MARVLLRLVCTACCCQSTVAEAGGNRWEALKFVSGFFGLDGEHKRQASGGQLTVIGAGFSRTGTKSLEAALLQLGHKIYDTRSIMELGHVDRWERAAENYGRSKDMTLVKELLEEMESGGYTATLDFPMNLFAPAFAELRPEAKVVMSVRENPQKWVESWRAVNWILGCFVLRPWCWFIDLNFTVRMLGTMMDYDWECPTYPDHVARPVPWFEIPLSLPGFDKPGKKESWIELHERFRGQLEKQFTKERLLIFDVRSGWAPLLKFLNIDDPEVAASPFPNVNDRSSLEAVRRVMDIIGAGLPAWVLMVFGILYVSIRGLCRQICCRSTTTKEKTS